MTQSMQSYDPARLVRDVVELLRERGLTVTFPDGKQAPASVAASALLRSLGITPGVDSETYYKRSTELIWGENQDVE